VRTIPPSGRRCASARSSTLVPYGPSVSSSSLTFAGLSLRRDGTEVAHRSSARLAEDNGDHGAVRPGRGYHAPTQTTRSVCVDLATGAIVGGHRRTDTSSCCAGWPGRRGALRRGDRPHLRRRVTARDELLRGVVREDHMQSSGIARAAVTATVAPSWYRRARRPGRPGRGVPSRARSPVTLASRLGGRHPEARDRRAAPVAGSR